MPHARSIFRVALVGALLASLAVPALAAPPATAPFDRTIIVNGGDTDLNNGAALLTAVNDAVLAGASATDPWLVKVEPGIFDLGTQTLQLRDFVDIEGSGRNATFIRSSPISFGLGATVNANAGVDSELRNLTVQNFAQNQGAAITNSSTELKYTLLNLEVEAGGAAIGFFSQAGDPRISAMFARVSSTGNNDATGIRISTGGPIINEMFVFINNSTPGDNFGIRVTSGASPIIEQVSGVVFGGTRNTGVSVQGSSPRITNNRWTVTGGSSATGLFVTDDTFLEVQESLFEATGASQNFAYENQTGIVELQTTRLFAGPAASAGGSVAAANTFGGETQINQSVLIGSTALLNSVAGSVFRVGSTRLAGARTFAAGSTAVCAASYDGAYAAVPPGC